MFMKVFERILTMVALFILVCFIYAWWNNRDYFETGENGNFPIKIDETVQFQLYENGSTGYQNCWINSSRCKSLAFVTKTYASNIQSRLGYIGSGGRRTFKFKGIEKGIDTVAITNCPTGREDKDYGSFSIDSIKPDNLFIINVK